MRKRIYEIIELANENDKISRIYDGYNDEYYIY